MVSRQVALRTPARAGGSVSESGTRQVDYFFDLTVEHCLHHPVAEALCLLKRDLQRHDQPQPIGDHLDDRGAVMDESLLDGIRSKRRASARLP